MPVLSDGDRAEAMARLMRHPNCPGGLTKPQLRNAINAVDQWLEDNAASFNSALPAGARTGLTARQKLEILSFVANRRAEV